MNGLIHGSHWVANPINGVTTLISGVITLISGVISQNPTITLLILGDGAQFLMSINPLACGSI